jgi:hypothetical protein
LRGLSFVVGVVATDKDGGVVPGANPYGVNRRAELRVRYKRTFWVNALSVACSITPPVTAALRQERYVPFGPVADWSKVGAGGRRYAVRK